MPGQPYAATSGRRSDELAPALRNRGRLLWVAKAMPTGLDE